MPARFARAWIFGQSECRFLEIVPGFYSLNAPVAGIVRGEHRQTQPRLSRERTRTISLALWAAVDEIVAGFTRFTG